MDKKLLLGVAIGVVSSAAVNFVMFRLHRPPMPPPSWAFSQEDFIRHFSDHMGLNDEQRQKAAPFLAAFHHESVESQKAHLAETSKAMEKLGTQLNDFETPEQREKLTHMREQVDKIRSRDLSELPPPPPPPY